MDIQIVERKKVLLLSRERVTAMVSFVGPTPSRDSLRQAIAATLHISVPTIIIKHVYTRFGTQGAKVIIHVYESEAAAKAVEAPHLLKKHYKEEKTVDAAPVAA